MIESLRLRAATADDQPFLRRVYASTRAEELAMAPWSDEEKERFLDLQFRAQHAWYHERYAGAEFWVIEEAGEAVGRLYLCRLQDEIRLMDIALLPDWRGRGIGAHYLRQLMAEAAEAGKPLRVHVEVFNRALSFYQGLGFRLLENRGVYLFLEWSAPPGDEPS